MKTFTLELKRMAKSKGGDRYESKETFEGKPMVIYLPQEVSRVTGEIIPQFSMTLEIG